MKRIIYFGESNSRIAQYRGDNRELHLVSNFVVKFIFFSIDSKKWNVEIYKSCICCNVVLLHTPC